jgi:hypothetical protein
LVLGGGHARVTTLCLSKNPSDATDDAVREYYDVWGNLQLLVQQFIDCTHSGFQFLKETVMARQQ